MTEGFNNTSKDNTNTTNDCVVDIHTHFATYKNGREQKVASQRPLFPSSMRSSPRFSFSSSSLNARPLQTQCQLKVNGIKQTGPPSMLT